MFDIGFLELVLVGIVALLVLGPERLPHAARMTGAFFGRITRMMQSVRDEVEREVNIFEMQQRIKKQVEDGMIGDLKKDLADAQKAIQQGFNASSSAAASAEKAAISPPVRTAEALVTDNVEAITADTAAPSEPTALPKKETP